MSRHDLSTCSQEPRKLGADLHPNDATPHSTPCGLSRRRILAAAAIGSMALVGAYGFSKIPNAYADENPDPFSDIIRVGLEQVPVSDGPIIESDYNTDTFDYQLRYSSNPPFSLTPPVKPEAHLHVKYKDITEFIIDVPSAIGRQASLYLQFDPQNTNDFSRDNKDIYSLKLYWPSQPNHDPSQPPIESNQPWPNGPIGVYLHDLFPGRYYWKYYYAPSPLSERNHSQFKFGIETEILTKYSSQINFKIDYVDAYGFLMRPFGPTKLKFEDQVLPDLVSTGLTAVGSLAIAKGLTKIMQNKKVSRRQLLGLGESA
jgi:hypothetical protein